MLSKQTPTHIHRGTRGLTLTASQHLHGNKANANMMSLLEQRDLRPMSGRTTCLLMYAAATRTPPYFKK